MRLAGALGNLSLLFAVPAQAQPVEQVKPVPGYFNRAEQILPKSPAPSGVPDVVGAFRFICQAGQLRYDDPIVYPGQPGKAHLHQFYGNLSADAHSSYESLRLRGESTCMGPLNRSAYWMPAMLDGKGSVIRPDYVAIYYKRRPASDPWCKLGKLGCIQFPRGLRYIFGWDQTRPNDPQPEMAVLVNWKCANAKGQVASGKAYPTMGEALAVCATATITDKQLFATITTPDCWDGKNLDSPDHRSHMARSFRDQKIGGQIACPATHPWNVAQFTLTAAYSIIDGDDTSLWRLSSDHMKPDGRPGETYHADWFGAWDDETLRTWHANCIDKLLSCADGDLGNGTIMKRPAGFGFKAVPRLVPVP